jgi:hypothetical protein
VQRSRHGRCEWRRQGAGGKLLRAAHVDQQAVGSLQTGEGGGMVRFFGLSAEQGEQAAQ